MREAHYLLSSEKIKAEAARLGFSACGMAKAGPVEQSHAVFYADWVACECHADMSYMERNVEKRIDPTLLVEGCRTIVSVALNYYPATFIPKDQPQISWYAYGKDYHDVMRMKLHELYESIASIHPDIKISGRCFCDTAPILERYWAWQCGLGWLGRNKQLIIPHAGSAFFLGEILLSVEADDYDEPIKSNCGTCTKCIDSCPMQALSLEKGLDARRCLSYLTIENRGGIPAEAAEKMYPCFYGCDRCQQVCPHMRHPLPTSEAAFTPSSDLLQMTSEDWQNLTEQTYQRLFKGSAIKRAKISGLRRNVEAMFEAEAEDIEYIS